MAFSFDPQLAFSAEPLGAISAGPEHLLRRLFGGLLKAILLNPFQKERYFTEKVSTEFSAGFVLICNTGNRKVDIESLLKKREAIRWTAPPLKTYWE